MATADYLSMTSDRDGIAEDGRLIKAGTKVTYIAHVYGGMVRVRLDNAYGPTGECVMHPHCFPKLRA